MTEEEELIALSDKLYQDYLTLPSVKEYFALRKALKENQRLNDLKKRRETLQKGMRYLDGEKKKECLKACQELEKEYQEDPLVVNYNASYLKAMGLLSQITSARL